MTVPNRPQPSPCLEGDRPPALIGGTVLPVTDRPLPKRKGTVEQMADSKPDPYQCSWCGRIYVVQLLARLCEEKHR